MSTKTLLRSFAGGEITPELAGRLDLVKYQTGLALCRNFMVLPHGPAVRRPGFEFVNFSGDASYLSPGVEPTFRLIPFYLDAQTSAVLEFGNTYIHIHINGATVLANAGQAMLDISSASPAVVEYNGADSVVDGGLVFINILTTKPELEGRFFVARNVNTTLNTFELYDQFGDPVDTSAMPPFTGGDIGNFSPVLRVQTPYATSILRDVRFAQSGGVLTITHPDHPAKELRQVSSTSWTLTDVSFSPSIAAPTVPTVVATVPTATNLSPQEYVVTAVAADGVTESLASPSATVNNNLSIAGNFNTISWSAVTGASRYYVYKRRGGGFGYMGQTTTLSAVDDNILPDTLQSPHEDIIQLNGSATNYPAAVAYHEQRRWFGGTTANPQAVWATRSGTESNLTNSIPSRDADALALRLASVRLHLVPLADMIALTTGGEFRIYSENAPAITPTTVSIKPQGYMGASPAQPVVTSGAILYVQSGGARIRELSYNWEVNSYRSVDMSIMAPHRFDGFSTRELAYSRAPDSVVWALRNDGILMGLSYVPEQQVSGWHFHDTDGEFMSICVVPEQGEDVLYAMVKRVIDGTTAYRLERMRTRFIDDIEDSFFLDSALTYSGAPATTISGLWHLEGAEVSILADGSVHPSRTVVDGSITLDDAYSKVQIGLPFVSDLQTLPLALETAQAGGQGTTKNVTRVHVRVRASSLLKAGPSFDQLREYPPRPVATPYGSPPPLQDGEFSLNIDPSWNQNGAVCIRQDTPLPLNVLAMTLELQTGG
jgi:hypothetical protein